jgi:CRP-like cAMP-binding protein
MTSEQKLIKALQAIPWFQGIPTKFFDKLAGISSLIEVKAGVDLYKQGDKQDYLYIIVEGRVANEIAIPGKGRARIYTADPVEMLGWSGVTPVERQRTTTAVTVLPSVLVRMKAADLNQLCEEDHTFGYLVMRRIANVAASKLLVSRLQLLDMFSHSSKEGSNA